MSEAGVLSGDLQFLTFPEVIQILHTNGCTGILRLKSPFSTVPGLVYFIKGAPVDASAGDKNGMDALYTLFGWLEGEFAFSIEKVGVHRLIKSGVMEIILDGTRMLDDGKILKLAPEDAASRPEDTFLDNSNLPIIRRPVSNYAYVLDEEEIPHGQNIVTEGRHGDWICIILDGYADVIRETEKDAITISRLGPGALIGNISSLISSKSVRTATLVAKGRVALGVLDMQRIHTEFSILTPMFRDVAMSLDRRLRQATDAVVDVHLGRLDPKRAVAEKKLMTDQGADDESAYMITQGEVCILRKTPKGPIPLALLKKRDFVGNIPCISMGHEPAGAAVYASEDCTLAPLDTEALQEEYDSGTSMVKAILDHVAACISVTTLIACDFEKMTGKTVKK